MRTVARALGLPFLLGAGLAFAPVAGAVTIHTVAVTGDPVPGAPPFTFDEFSSPAINAPGDVAVAGRYDGSTQRGVFTEVAGVLGEVVLHGDPAPGTASTFDRVSSVRLNAAGEVAFLGRFNGGAQNGDFTNAGGTLADVALEGIGSVPGSAPDTFTTVEPVLLNDDGNLALLGHYGTGQQGVFYYSGGGLIDVALSDATFPSFSNVLLNNQNRISYRGDDSSGESTLFYRDGDGTTGVVLRTGDPGFLDPVSGNTFASIALHSQNDAGDVAVGAFVDTSAVRAIFKTVGGGAELRSVAREGDIAPGTGGLAFNFIGNGSELIDQDGDVYFRASYPTGSAAFQDGLFANIAGRTAEIALQGLGNAPGTTSDFAVGSPFFTRAVAPSSGHNAFVATTADAREGLWATDGNGDLQLVAITGQQWDVDGTLRTVSGVRFAGESNGQDGFGSGLNDGQLAFALDFSDGLGVAEGVFVAELGAPPAGFGYVDPAGDATDAFAPGSKIYDAVKMDVEFKNGFAVFSILLTEDAIVNGTSDDLLAVISLDMDQNPNTGTTLVPATDEFGNDEIRGELFIGAFSDGTNLTVSLSDEPGNTLDTTIAELFGKRVRFAIDLAAMGNDITFDATGFVGSQDVTDIIPATPVPEPDTLVLVGIGAVLLGGKRTRLRAAGRRLRAESTRQGTAAAVS